MDDNYRGPKLLCLNFRLNLNMVDSVNEFLKDNNDCNIKRDLSEDIMRILKFPFQLNVTIKKLLKFAEISTMRKST